MPILGEGLCVNINSTPLFMPIKAAFGATINLFNIETFPVLRCGLHALSVLIPFEWYVSATLNAGFYHGREVVYRSFVGLVVR